MTFPGDCPLALPDEASQSLARKMGFDSRDALKLGMDKMTASATQPAKTTLVHSEPQLFVSNLEEALSFYLGKLGFEIAFSHGEPPFYAQVCREGARLNLRRTSHPAFDREFKEREADPLSATIALDDARPLFLEFERRRVDFHQRLRTEPWGARTFIVRDPDGNLICFAGQRA